MLSLGSAHCVLLGGKVTMEIGRIAPSFKDHNVSLEISFSVAAQLSTSKDLNE